MSLNTLAAWRARHGRGGISKAHVARQIGVSRSYIGKIEDGSRRPSAAVQARLAAYFGCAVEALFPVPPEGPPCP